MLRCGMTNQKAETILPDRLSVRRSGYILRRQQLMVCLHGYQDWIAAASCAGDEPE
jgi:hypothetical protein